MHAQTPRKQQPCLLAAWHRRQSLVTSRGETLLLQSICSACVFFQSGNHMACAALLQAINLMNYDKIIDNWRFPASRAF